MSMARGSVLALAERGRRAWQAAVSSLQLPPSSARAIAAGDPEPVRTAMRELLPGLDGLRAARLHLAIGRCRDLPGLWYLRAPLMEALAAAYGEAPARARMAALDACFLRAWPDAPVARRSRLR